MALQSRTSEVGIFGDRSGNVDASSATSKRCTIGNRQTGELLSSLPVLGN